MLSRSQIRRIACSSLSPRKPALQSLTLSARYINTSPTPSPLDSDRPVGEDIPSRLIGTREELDRKRLEFERKYGEKIKKRMEEEKVSDIKELKRKVSLAALSHAALATKAINTSSFTPSNTTSPSPVHPTPTTLKTSKINKTSPSRSSDPNHNPLGPRPLSSILNLPLIYSAPHTPHALSLLWSSYHLTHPTLSSTYLSASIPPKIYRGMIKMAREKKNFVVPLLRSDEVSLGGGEPAFEMFYLQWLEHPTPNAKSEDITKTLEGEGEGDVIDGPLPMTSVIFTPLEEFKNNKEWAQPQLVLTHYPDLHNNPQTPTPSSPSTSSTPSTMSEKDLSDSKPQHHPLILMRGEISPSSTKSSLSSPLPSQALALSQAQAQLLTLALQRFYCADLEVKGESERQRNEREERGRCLRGFGSEEWDWKGLVKMAFGGVV